MPGLPRRAGKRLAVTALGLALLGTAVTGVEAQGATDRSAAPIGPEDRQAVLDLIARDLRSPDARVTDLRRGRAGGICGTVEVRNRMGAYTGPRPFVAELDAAFVGRLPESAELRNPGSMAEFSRLDRARTMFLETCIDR